MAAADPKPASSFASETEASSVGLILLSVYAFLLSSQASQFLGAYAGVRVPLVAIILGIVAVAYLVNGKVLRFASSPFIIPWTAMFIWWLFTSFTGIFPGRSVFFMVKDYSRVQVIPFLICGIALSFEHVRKVMTGVTAGWAVVLFFCFKSGQLAEGRLFIPDTPLANPNDLAMHIVLFGCLAFALLAGGKGLRIFLLTAIPVALYYVLKTGSRANLLTVAMLLLVGFVLLPVRQKMIMVVLTIFLGVVMVPFLPDETKSRLQSFFSSSSDSEQNSNAVDSTNARIDLQMRAIQLTGENFIVGIGPGNFMDAVNEMVIKHGGLKSGWQVAHNSYLQVSAETGIPGMIFYVWNIVLCLKLNFQAFKRFKNQPGSRVPFLVTFSLLAATCTYAFGVFFTTIPYDFQLSLLIGLTAAMHLALKEQDARNLATSPVAGFALPRRAARQKA